MSDAPKPAISPKMCYIVRIENFRKLLNIFNQFLEKNGAASVIRTRDLTLTKGALYHWSYSSTRSFNTLGPFFMQVEDQKRLAV